LSPLKAQNEHSSQKIGANMARSNDVMPSLQDFSLIKTYVDKVTKEQELTQSSVGFMFFILDLVLGLQEDEIKDAITDTSYLHIIGKEKGHDRGIDAIYIDESENPATVHFFNFKYTDQFKKTTSHFPSGEIDKIINFLLAILQQDESLSLTINKSLFSKAQEIWGLFNSQNPKFIIHLSANFYNGLEAQEQKRFERDLGKFSNFSFEYHLAPWIVSRVTRKGKQVVNARLRAIDKNIFEKSDGDIRALIVDIDARDLLRMVIDDEDLRCNVDLQDYMVLQKHRIIEDAFEDNVRVYLKQRSKINRNIKETALSDDAHRFFYFNNGITITCDHFDYPKQVRAPIISLEHLQVVNGSQTIHALFEAFTEDPNRFENMDVLCRIYETRNDDLSTDIAEYTNSQNPVKSRDIRSNDYLQKKLERELEALGYFYERKKGQHSGRPKSKRIDAEKAGQALLAFANRMPAESKDAKRLIFAEKYDDIFNDQLTADSVLLAIELFNQVEQRKEQKKNNIISNPKNYDSESFILHSTYYIMFVLSDLADVNKISKEYGNISSIFSMYDDGVNLIRQVIELEKQSLKGYKERYTHRMFFKGSRPKMHLEALIKKLKEDSKKGS
jgi:hypothetical protein